MEDQEERARGRPESRPRPSSSRGIRESVSSAVARTRPTLSSVKQPSIRRMIEDESDESADENRQVKHHDHDRNDEDDDEDEDDDDDVQAPVPEGAYDPKEFEHLPAPPEIKELFQYITKYVPQQIDLEYRLEPFIPDYIPAVGDPDYFLKVSRPDEKASTLGLSVLDEPALNQSDPAVLQLQLRAASKQTLGKKEIVKKVENAVKNHKAIDRWIKDINNLHKSKPSSSLNYSNSMPDVDTLMQEWPDEIEEQLSTLGLSKVLNCDLLTYVDMVCASIDIPVYESRVESLHLFFSLYAAVKSLQMKADPANVAAGLGDNSAAS